MSVSVFVNASRTKDVGRMGVIIGLLIGNMYGDLIYRAVSWVFHKAKRPVRSAPAAKVFAAAEGIDEGKIVRNAYYELLDVHVKLFVCVDSEDLFSSISTQKNSVDKSIRGDVAGIRFEFEGITVDSVPEFPGSTNLADPLTKKDSSLTETLRLTLSTGRLCTDFDAVSETKFSLKNFG